jgi:hypothetical protein
MNIPTGSYSGFLFNKEASNVDQMGRRIAESTSNFDQSLKARLAANEQSSNMRLSGKLRDREIVEKNIKDQLTSDAAVDQYNLGVQGQNAQRIADLRKNVSLINANKESANFTN